MKKIIIALAVTFLIASTVYAADLRDNCGCGLGSMFFQGKDGMLTNTAAALTNGVFGNQTFGISSGTLGCQRPARWVQNERLNQFVSRNMDNLAVDIAAGQGESLDTLAELTQIPAEKRTGFFTVLQENFSDIYPSAQVSHTHVIAKIAGLVEQI